QVTEPAGHPLSKRAEALLSRARSGSAGGRNRRYGRFRAERYRARVRRRITWARRKNVYLGGCAPAMVFRRGETTGTGRKPGPDDRQEYSVRRRKRAGPGDS